MRSIFKLSLLAITLGLFVTTCQKVEELPHYEKGSPVQISASKQQVVATVADSTTEVISFSWTDPKYATDSAHTKFIIEIDSTTRNFAKKATKEVIGNLSVGFTGRELNAIMLNNNLNVGTAYNMDVRVISSYLNNNEKYTSNVIKIAVTPYADPSKLVSSQTAVTLALATAAQPSNTFTWTQSFKGYSGVVTYTLQYDSAGKNFGSVHEMTIGPSLLSKVMTQGEMNQTALDEGVPGGNTGKIEYRIKAITAGGAVAYSNPVSVTIQSYLPILRFYLPGSYQAATGQGTNWDPPSAPEFIRDVRSNDGIFNRLYYMYVYLPAGSAFKITQGRDWGINYGGSGGNLVAGGADLTVTNAGVYRISIDRVNLKYEIREGRMGFVGDGAGAVGWNPPNVFPNYAMGSPYNNVFVGVNNFVTGSGWKLIDNDAWNSGSNAYNETRSYGAAGPSGSTLSVNGPDFSAVTTAGRYRVIWDGRDANNIKYEMSPATEMRLVGDGINQVGVNDWDPPTSPQMTYAGNGVWTITIALKADKSIKFLAGNAWGAFDYEDNSGQNNALGVARKIKWDGGPDFKTPAAAGTYTITLDEKNGTATINP